MLKAKDLTQAEKCIIVKEMAKGTIPKVITTSIGRHVDTAKRYLSNPSLKKTRTDAGVLKRVTDRNRRNIYKRQLFKSSGRTSKTIFRTSKSARNFEINAMPVTQRCNKEPYASKTTSHNTTTQCIAVKWAKKYMKTDMKKAIFTDETRATLDSPDGWEKGWVSNGQKHHCRLMRQQGGVVA